MSFLELSDLNFAYVDPKNTVTFRLKNINLSINKGEFITILGPNGSGKSTLLKIIAGLISPLEGSYSLAGKKISGYSDKERAGVIAYVPQKTISVFPFSVYEIVMMGRTPYLGFSGFESEGDIKAVDEALKTVEMYELRFKGINEISGGEAQRAFLARALAQEPELLLLDEANAHLDIHHQISIFDLIKKLNIDLNLTVISVSHDLNLAAQYGRRTLLMDDGKILLDDSPEAILTEQEYSQCFSCKFSYLPPKRDKFL